jgi:hypothetical protein
MASVNNQITLTLTLPASTPPHDPNGWQRLRRLLKSLLRSYGLRCVDIRRMHDEARQFPKPNHNDIPNANQDENL